jgi:hypothetical protein
MILTTLTIKEIGCPNCPHIERGNRMSLAISADDVTAVLLADGWHEVAARSFDLDSYEYHEHADGLMIHGGGASGVCSTGFEFTTDEGDRLAGPLTAVLAVRHGKRGAAARPAQAAS